MEEIKEALENKEVERIKETPADNDASPDRVVAQTAKSKKVRSQKQIEAFERARKKRSENIALKKKLPKTEIKESIIDKLPVDLVDEFKRTAIKTPQVGEDRQLRPQLITPAHPPGATINYNYYYGAPPPQHAAVGTECERPHHSVPQSAMKKKKVILKDPVFSESSSDDEVYNESELIQGGIKPTTPSLKYKFV